MISTRLSNECGNRQRKSDESKTTYFLTHVDFAEQKIKHIFENIWMIDDAVGHEVWTITSLF